MQTCEGHMMPLLCPLVLLGLCLITHSPVGEAQTIDQIISLAMASSYDADLIQDEHTVRVELDMLFTREDWTEIQSMNNADTEVRKKRRHKRKAARAERLRWTNRVVPYTIAANHFTPTDLQQIRAGIDDWERYTCLDFRQATSSDVNRLYIFSGSGCSSYVGMVGGQQSVSLGFGCRQKGVVVHELGHAIGFHHEQTRPDRHNHVQILLQNIQGGTEYNFQQYNTDVQRDYSVAYDYTSVMHYGQYAFSANGQPTIRTLDSSKQHLIGNRQGHSFRDIKLANLMYDCDGNCGTKTCPGEGFVGKDCQCYCPGSPIQICDGGGGGGEEECTDDNMNCAFWSANGECSKNPNYMLVNCKVSCNNCDDDGGMVCEDANVYCDYWQKQSYCTSNLYQTYMEEHCMKSCQLCGVADPSGASCKDEQEHCAYWESIGECEENPDYMLPNCMKSCNMCGA